MLLYGGSSPEYEKAGEADIDVGGEDWLEEKLGETDGLHGAAN